MLGTVNPWMAKIIVSYKYIFRISIYKLWEKMTEVFLHRVANTIVSLVMCDTNIGGTEQAEQQPRNAGEQRERGCGQRQRGGPHRHHARHYAVPHRQLLRHAQQHQHQVQQHAPHRR